MEHSSVLNMQILENRKIKNVSVADADLPIKWHLYWLKQTEYNRHIHTPFNGCAPMHTHSFFEVQILKEGSLQYQLGDSLIDLDEGDFWIVCPKSEHCLKYRSNEMKKLSVGFELFYDGQDELGKSLEHLRKLPFYKGKASSSMISSLNMLLYDLDEKEAHADFLKRELLNVFFLSMMKEIKFHDTDSDEEKEKEQEKIEANDETVYQAVINYLQMHMDKNVSLNELSDVLLISVSQLYRRLVHYSGRTFSSIKDEIKCARARDLLATNLSMDQISEAIGMSNEYSFNRFFKRVEGMTPGRFRQSLQSNNYK